MTLAGYFATSRHDAAKQLRIGETSFKQKCRGFGIKRWPGRKLHTLRNLIALCLHKDGTVDACKKWYFDQLLINFQDIMRNPDTPLSQIRECVDMRDKVSSREEGNGAAMEGGNGGGREWGWRRWRRGTREREEREKTEKRERDIEREDRERERENERE